MIDILHFLVLAGTFTGSGQANDANGWSAACPSITVTIEENDDTLKIVKHDFACGAISSMNDSVVLTKKGSELQLDGQRVGLRGETEMDAVVPAKGINDLLVVYRISRRGEQLIYKESWLSQQDGGVTDGFDLEGTLTRQP